MLPGIEQFGCGELAVPIAVMQRVVAVESSYNPFAIGVVGGRLARQPRSLDEAVATARMLEAKGRNFSVGLAQVNRHNLEAQGLAGYAQAFSACSNLAAGARILADCRQRARGDWNKAFSCYYSGNFVTGFRHGYVQKIHASMRAADDRQVEEGAPVIPLARTQDAASRRSTAVHRTAPVAAAPGSSGQAMGRPAPSLSEPVAWPAEPSTAPQAMAVATVTNPVPPVAGIAPLSAGAPDAADAAFVF
ncbi:MAG: hypothetical protein A2190_07010 [Lysobacterales bacterium RIFOXYA1_FULL_69_10]|nr:MAG: hypothetical protein A2190_07010 [Xanthomonadales bacterium RIFOXYA1_FULL_69_10]